MAIAEETSVDLDVLAPQVDAVVRRYVSRPSVEQVPAWVLPPASCELLRDLAALLPAPVRAFEFGSGRSTHILRSISSQTMSVEHSAEFLRQTEANAKDKRPGDESVVVPLRRRWNRLRLIETFDLAANAAALNWLGNSRFILVDSPPNPAKREDALYLALQSAPVGAIIVIDDLEVRATRRFSSRLAWQNPSLLRFWPVPIDHRLGVFLKIGAGSLHSIPTLREFVGTWLRV